MNKRQCNAVGEWQPIETAPKDGSYFIGKYGNQVFATHWQAFNVFGSQKPGGGCEVVGQTYNWSHLESGSYGYGSPTHWIPMPHTPTANKGDAPASKPDCETCKRNGNDCTHQEIPKACVCDQYAPENKGDAPVMMRGCQSTDCEVHICRHAVDHVRQDGCEGNDEGCPPCIPVKDGVK